jgi:hypothetical protein
VYRSPVTLPGPGIPLITHLRISFSGAVVTEGTWPLLINPMLLLRPLTMLPPRPTGFKDIYRISLGTVDHEHGMPSRLDGDILFNIKTGAFGRQGAKTKGWLPGRQDTENPTSLHETSGMLKAAWKGHTVCPDPDGDSKGYISTMSLMNDTFLVSLDSEGDKGWNTRVRVYCFDEQVDMYAAHRYPQADY